MEDFKRKIKKPGEEENFFEEIQEDEEIVGEVVEEASGGLLEEDPEAKIKKEKEDELRQQAKARFSKLAEQYRQKLDSEVKADKHLDVSEREARTIEENLDPIEESLQQEFNAESSENDLIKEELEALRSRLGVPMPFRVVLTISGEELQNLVFDQDIVTIGRDANCDIVIDNLGVSRVHAEIERLGKLYFLRDKMSKTGTFVKGKRIEEHVLNTGDEFFLAKHTLYFHKLDESARNKQSQKKATANPKAIKHMARTMAVDFRHLAQKQEVAPAYLHIAETTRRIPVNKNAFFFGKAEDCDAQTGGFLIGERHAVLVHEKKGFFLHHIGLFKPPIVNKKKVENTKLKDGDVIKIGDMKFIFAIAGGKPEEEEEQ
ncbi:MAG: FHA domain-containing protein [Candidatus Brocadiae bacterium]|nr:FHA domain-containing protein [Candidatus Brocadiia bacterium]